VSHLIVSDRTDRHLRLYGLIGGHATYDFYDENSAGRMITADELPALFG